MIDWTQVLMALAAGLPATLTALGAIVQGWRNSRKIDENTKITKDGTEAATTHAQVAATTAIEAKDAAQSVAEDVSRKLNGELDARISKLVKEQTDPLAKRVNNHAEQDEANMVEIRNAIADLKNSLTQSG